MIGFVLARRYAQALIDLASEENIIAEVGGDLDEIAGLFEESSELAFVFANPTISIQEKKDALSAILDKTGVQNLTKKFVSLLLEKNRIMGIEEIAAAYQSIADTIHNRVRTRVVVASPLGKGDEKKVREALSKLTGKEVILEVEVDESILGGIVAYVGSQVYDWSLANQLEQVKDSLSSRR